MSVINPDKGLKLLISYFPD